MKEGGCDWTTWESSYFFIFVTHGWGVVLVSLDVELISRLILGLCLFF